MSLVIRATGDPRALEPQARAAVQAIDPELPLFGVRPMRDIVAANLASRRFAVTAVGGNFWATDVNVMPIPGTIEVALSNGTIETFEATGNVDTEFTVTSGKWAFPTPSAGG